MSIFSSVCWLTPAVAVSFCFLSGTAWAQSVVPAADGTGTQVIRQGDRYDIEGGSLSRDGQNLFHSFERLGLSADEAAQFLSNPQIQTILGRVTGGDASIIDGLLRVSGGDSNLYLINPAGIVFGPNARLDLPAAFTATTATGIEFADGWFSAIGANDYGALVGSPTAFGFGLDQPGTLVNLGDLAVAEGQSLTLVAGTVVNTGTLAAPGGTLTVAAVPGESRVRLSQAGSLLSVEIEPWAGSETQSMTLTPARLPQLLTGGDLPEVTALTVAPDGTVRLTDSGAVVSPAVGSAVLAGMLTTAAPETAAASQITVLGDRLFLFGATLDASGDGGGGTIRVGGNYQGQPGLPTATQTWVDAQSSIAADALAHGDGGRVILWSEADTRFVGTLTARGGTAAGNGGFAEVSGRNGLGFDGSVDVSAPQGEMGTLLLDPAIIEIGVNGADNGQLDDGEILATDPGGIFFITPDRIVQLLQTGNVTLAATTLINVADPINAFANTVVSDLTLTAPDITLDDVIVLNGGALTLNGDVLFSDANFQPGLISAGGSVTVNGTLDRPLANGGITISADTIALNDTVGGLGGDPLNLQVTGVNAAFNSTAISQLNGLIVNLTGDLTLSGQTFNIQDAQIFTIGAFDAQTQGFTISRSEVNAENLTVQAVAMNVNDTTLRSHQDITLQSQTNLAIRNDLAGSNNIVAGGAVQITAQAGSLQIQDSAADSLLIEGGSGITLQGGTGITLDALNNRASVFRSPADITLISDGTVTANGRFGAGGDFAVLDTTGAPRAFTTTDEAATGIISASGNVTFGDYTGVALWVEALGSIQAGNIDITGENPTLTGTAPEVALLSSSGSVIMRAGVAQLTSMANLLAPTVIEGTTFTPSAATGGNLTVGNISAGFDGRVILSANGTLTTGDLFGPAGIDLSAQGSITTGNLNTNINGETLDYGQVRLVSQDDITVSSIRSGAGGVDVTAAGSFRVLGYNTALLDQVVPLRGNTELINYLISQGVPAAAFSDPTLVAEFLTIRTGSFDGTFDPGRTDNLIFPDSILARPSGGVMTSSGYNAPVVIRYGGAGSTLVDDQFAILGRPGRITVLGSGESFVTGPVTTPEDPPLVPNVAGDAFATFDPTAPFQLRVNTLYGLRPADDLADASGTVGAIAVGQGSNISLYGSLQNNTFAPPPPDPIDGGDPGDGGTPIVDNPDDGGTPIVDNPDDGGTPIVDPGDGGTPIVSNPGGDNPVGTPPGADGEGAIASLPDTAAQSQLDDDGEGACEVAPATVPTGVGAVALRSAGTPATPCLTRSVEEESLLQVDPTLLPNGLRDGLPDGSSAPAIAPQGE